MSLNDVCAERVCQQTHSSEDSLIFNESSAHGSTDCNTTPYRRRRQTNQALEALGHLVKDNPSEEVEEKLNKNDILGLTIARLLRCKYIPFSLVNPNIQLQSCVDSFKPREEFNGFFLVLNTLGRIIFISDNAEFHLRKNVRSLYSQLTNIFQCIDGENHGMMRKILSSRSSNDQQMICTWNLPRGKRPSRAHTESKTILITGHYFYLHTDKDQHQQEPLFLARCEQILSSTPNIPTNSIGSSSNMIVRFLLNENFHISEVTPNVQALLNYKPEDLIDIPLSCLVTSESWGEMLTAKDNSIHVQHCTTMSVTDMYTADGHRLTFLCNFYGLSEGKRKPIKFGFIAQLIDPSIRDQYTSYIKKQNDERLKSTVGESMIPPNSSMNNGSTSLELNSFPLGDQYFIQNTLASVCPVTMIPQRRKRRNLEKQTLKSNHSKKSKIQAASKLQDDFHQTSMIINSNSLSPLSDNSILSASPIQEISFPDDFFSQIDTIFVEEKSEFTLNFSLDNDVDDLIGVNTNYHQSLFLSTPTLPSCSFFA